MHSKAADTVVPAIALAFVMLLGWTSLETPSDCMDIVPEPLPPCSASLVEEHNRCYEFMNENRSFHEMLNCHTKIASQSEISQCCNKLRQENDNYREMCKKVYEEVTKCTSTDLHRLGKD